MEANISVWKLFGTRIISGLLTASMILSLFTPAMATSSAETEERPTTDQTEPYSVAPDTDPDQTE